MSLQFTHGYTVYECMYPCPDYDLLIMNRYVNFCEINIHSFNIYFQSISDECVMAELLAHWPL